MAGTVTVGVLLKFGGRASGAQSLGSGSVALTLSASKFSARLSVLDVDGILFVCIAGTSKFKLTV